MTFSVPHITEEDMTILRLKELYSSFGYRKYKMSRFEEYDLYIENRDFLISDKIISFTDTNGKLMALKPDVTLSIVKNFDNQCGSVHKVYYDENIYRAKGGRTLEEIHQMGIEAMGDIDLYHVCEVISLASETLGLFGREYILSLSHMAVIGSILSSITSSHELKGKLLKAVSEKNKHEIIMLCRSACSNMEAAEDLVHLLDTFGPLEKNIASFEKLRGRYGIDSAIDEIIAVSRILSAGGIRNVHLDFSIVNDMNYYNGILFRGYLKDIPSGVLSGGRYDDLMSKMGKDTCAVGFAVNLDLLSENIRNSDEAANAALIYEPEDDPAFITAAVKKLIKKDIRVSALPEGSDTEKFDVVYKLTEKGAEHIG